MNADCAKVVDYLRKATDEVVKEQVKIAEIPVLRYSADERAAYLMRQWRAAGLRPVRDEVGNVVAHARGTRPAKHPTLVVSAHLDSVFHGLKGIRVRRKGSVLHAPGICDDAAGVADLIVLVRAIRRFGAGFEGDVVFVGSVGEESGHEVWGMEHFWKKARYRKPYFLGVDGGIPGRIVTRALSTWSPTITVKGPGGHSYVCFGRPNPVHMLSRIVTKMTRMKVNRAKDAIYNANMVSGGTASNVIPEEASVTLNLRSSDQKELERMRKQVLGFIREARRDELKWATSQKRLSYEITGFGRPGGRIKESHPLVVSAARALAAEGHKVQYTASSTDANMPMSLGIPSITISAGGRAENMHSLSEWHDTKGRTRELAALTRIVFDIAG